MTKQYHFGNVCGDKGLVTPNDEWLIENVNSITDLEKNWDTVLDVLNEQHEIIQQQYADLETQIDIHKAYKQQVQETLQKHYDLTKKTKDYHIAMELESLSNKLGIVID